MDEEMAPDWQNLIRMIGTNRKGKYIRPDGSKDFPNPAGFDQKKHSGAF
jgi:hypothetical protein